MCQIQFPFFIVKAGNYAINLNDNVSTDIQRRVNFVFTNIEVFEFKYHSK